MFYIPAPHAWGSPRKTSSLQQASNCHNPFLVPVDAATKTEAQTEASQYPNGLGKACPQAPSEQDWVLLNRGCPQQTYALEHQSEHHPSCCAGPGQRFCR